MKIVQCVAPVLLNALFGSLASAAVPDQPPLPPSSAESSVAAAPAPTAASAATGVPPQASTSTASSMVLLPDKPCQPCKGEDHKPNEGAGMLVAGVAVLDLSSLNKRLHANGYERVPSALTMIGGEGRAVFDSGFVAGVRGAGIFTPSGSGPGGMQTHFSGGYGTLDFGFAFLHSERFLATVTGDVGGYGTSLGISDGQNVSFDDALANPRRSLTLARGGLLLGATLGFDARVPLGGGEHGRRGFFTIGLRLGALFGPALTAWNLGDAGQATGGPSSGLNGGFATMVLGFGGGLRRPGFE